MSDFTERPEEALRRVAKECLELQEWKRKYQEAAQLWDALEPEEGQQVMSAVLVGKLVKFDESDQSHFPFVSIAATDGVDWMDQMGILDAAHDFIHSEPWGTNE